MVSQIPPEPYNSQCTSELSKPSQETRSNISQEPKDCKSTDHIWCVHLDNIQALAIFFLLEGETDIGVEYFFDAILLIYILWFLLCLGKSCFPKHSKNQKRGQFLYLQFQDSFQPAVYPRNLGFLSRAHYQCISCCLLLTTCSQIPPIMPSLL